VSHPSNSKETKPEAREIGGHIEPVWKENVLPVILYKDRFKEMEMVAKRTMVRFRWSEDLGRELTHDGNLDGDVTQDMVTQKFGWVRKRKRVISSRDVDLLLVAESNA
jgi:hypothetical protein